jgi:Fe2+ or Zn2+ uptake regulation protein
MRHSRQRNLILEIVQTSSDHPTADWIYNQARKKLPNISLGTVYRNLGQLVNNKNLKTVNVNGVVHYDAFLSNHQHFQCNSCGKLFDININIKDFELYVDSNTNHKIDNCHVQLNGICETCQNN